MSNYGTIKADLIRIINRDDCDDALAGTFIQQAQSIIQRDLRVPAMEQQIVTTVAVDFRGIDIPDDFLQLHHHFIEGHGELERLDLTPFINLVPSREGLPRFFTRDMDRWRVWPNPPVGTEIKTTYYREAQTLVLDTDTSWLVKIAPDVLTYCALELAADHFLDERLPRFQQKWQEGGSALTRQAEAQNMSGQMVIQPAYQYPGE